MTLQRYQELILNEVAGVLANVSEEQTKRFVAEIGRSGRIYITGQGRSGLVVKAFGQRLMHLGYDVHLADEITAPAITRGDILVACSGTGRTQLTLYMAKKAHRIGARVIVLTANPRSAIARHAKLLIAIPVPVSRNGRRGKGISRQPVRSLFEQALFIYLDSVIIALIDILGIRREKIERRHANLE